MLTFEPEPTRTNTGHGHVRPRADGVKARCGGPGLCSECRREAGAMSYLGHVSSPPLVPAKATPFVDDVCPTQRDPAARQIIGFTGLKGSGKSEAAKHLISLGFKRGKFAGALKEMIRTLLRYRGCGEGLIERCVEGDLKEVPCAALNGRTPRHAMQTLGTEWGRMCVADGIWVDTEMDFTRALPRLVFDDVRFPNEAEAIRRERGIVVRIERPGIVSGLHSSEGQDLREDVSILNDGTLAALQFQVDQILRNLSHAMAGTH